MAARQLANAYIGIVSGLRKQKPAENIPRGSHICTLYYVSMSTGLEAFEGPPEPDYVPPQRRPLTRSCVVCSSAIELPAVGSANQVYCGSHCRQMGSWARRYGLPPRRIPKIYDEQGGACAICQRAAPLAKMKVDQCGETSRVRGLLCDACSRGLGNFNDVGRLQRAIEYLQADRA